ncbi:hypothetical protein [Streptomyces subrutilus]|uniref:Uncharacterized protein n=1 Tax=Streptomyces subrutilus TaxID=36818 RepID=A0A5P2UQ54_9ACTN|nr:hypothetical protein [Streptomyces subrutilus]QEU78827.1 hypothetical protein CP968_11465 [Streptomyces subrutilus]WSJ31984.1 hypothetical protein OG479_23405 [Streptomyces subrutilus]GGZ57340.1 hypothetical protein GCM10010371_15920 [Streptomyces subrutilus]
MAALIIRDVAQRILADETGTVAVHTEAARLNRAGVLFPATQEIFALHYQGKANDPKAREAGEAFAFHTFRERDHRAPHHSVNGGPSALSHQLCPCTTHPTDTGVAAGVMR